MLAYIFFLVGKEHNFKKMKADTGGMPYDYGSVMHYGAYAFSRNRRPTISPRRPVRIGQRKGLSAIDWSHVKRAYC